MLYMGLDIGTQGVRCVVVNRSGALLAQASVPFAQLNIAPDGLYEQAPADWQAATESAIRSCTAALRGQGIDPARIRTLSVDGTSGTIVPLDARFQPLMNGIMYNDPRAKKEAALVHAALPTHEQKLGLQFGASFSLPRIKWVCDNRPEIYEKTDVFAHQADYVVGLLSGEYRVSDYSNALKTGYDLIDDRWPAELNSLHIDADKLPTIVRPGAPIARLTRAAADALGMSEHTLVVGGSTDGYASALAAGAVKSGCWASVIGTTFVLKGVTSALVIDPNGSSYSHKLPSGEWLLGGASNLGGVCLNQYAQGRSFKALDAQSEALIPTGVRCYPLTGRGERFPFVNPDCEGFYCGNPLEGRLYPALMEGVGFGERLAYEHMLSLGCTVGDTIHTTGGACRSPLWLKIRAAILNRCLRVPEVADAAMGSALVAASTDMGGLAEAATGMLRYTAEIEPNAALAKQYEELYQRFLIDLKHNMGPEV